VGHGSEDAGVCKARGVETEFNKSTIALKVYEYIIRLKDQATDKISRLANAASSGKSKVDAFSGSMNKATNSSNFFAEALSGVTRYLGPAALIAGLSMGITKASALAREFEQTRISYEVMLGGAEAGNKMLNDTIALANVTPFTSRDLQASGKTLLGFGVEAKKIIPTLRMLGDVSGGNSERLRLLSLAFAQSQAAGRLMGQDLLQMVNSGFNPLQVISEKTGLSIGELKKKMEEGAISAKMVEAAFISATSEGGRFFGMMDKQSQTVEGKMSTVADKLEIAFTQVGENINRLWSPLLDKIIKVLDHGDIKSSISGFKKQTNARGELSALYESYQGYKGTPFEKEFEQKILDQFPELGSDFSSGKSAKLSDSKVKDKLSSLEFASMAAERNIEKDFKQIGGWRKEIDKLQDEINTGKISQSSVFDRLIGSDKLSEDDIKNRIDDIDKLGKKIKETTEAYTKFNSSNNRSEAAKKLLLAMRGGVGNSFGELTEPTKGKSKKEKDGTDKITGGGKQAINVTINISTLNGIGNIEKVNGEMEINGLMDKMKKVAVEKMIEVVNSANYAQAQ